MTQLSHNSWISIGLALTLAGVIFSAGILYNKVDTQGSNLTEFKKETAKNLTAINKRLDSLLIVKGITMKP